MITTEQNFQKPEDEDDFRDSIYESVKTLKETFKQETRSTSIHESIKTLKETFERGTSLNMQYPALWMLVSIYTDENLNPNAIQYLTFDTAENNELLKHIDILLEISPLIDPEIRKIMPIDLFKKLKEDYSNKAKHNKEVLKISKDLSDLHKRVGKDRMKIFKLDGKITKLLDETNFRKISQYSATDLSIISEVQNLLTRYEKTYVVSDFENFVYYLYVPENYSSSKNQTLPIISLILGILGIVFFLFSIGAVIIGFLGIRNVNNNSNHYGGRGLAIAGIIIGSITLFAKIILLIIIFTRQPSSQF